MPPPYGPIGDILQGVSAVSILAYTVMVLKYAEPGSNVFDEQWVHDGFCVINKDVPYFSSHDICFYCDTLLALVGWGIYEKLKNSGPEMKLNDDIMKFSLLGHFGHGVGHAAIAYHLYRSGEPDLDGSTNTLEKFAEMDTMARLPMLCVLFVFWCGLLKGAMPKFSMGTIAMFSVPALLGQLVVKVVFSFGYVQAVLSVAFTITQLKLPSDQKHFGYLGNAIAMVSVSLVPWVECMACQSFASMLGGHLIYDVAIPVCLGTSYVASWYHFHQDRNTMTKKTV